MNEENNNFSVDTEQLKSETKDTVNQVKDTIKNADFKEGAAQTKGFLMDMFSKPISTVKKVASEEENVLFKAIMIMMLYIGISFVRDLIYTLRVRKYITFGNNLIFLAYSIIQPMLVVLIPAILVFVLNKKNKKTLTTILCTLVVASVPCIVTELITLINDFSSSIVTITSIISTIVTAVGYVLTYFGMKELFEEDDDKFIKTFAIIKLISAFAFLIIREILF